MVSSILRILILSFALFGGSFLFGMLPLWASVFENAMQSTSVFGAGLIVGTALAVILPEGVGALLSSSSPQVPSSLPNAQQHDGAKLTWISVNANSNEPAQVSHVNEKQSEKVNNVEYAIGPALLSGFLLMLLVDQLQTATLPAWCSHSNYQSTSNIPEEIPNSSSSLPFHNSSYHDYSVTDVQSGMIMENGEHASQRAVATTIGMIIHSFSDGIAMGVASATAHSRLELVVFLAILLHKAPASFGLVIHLMHSNSISRQKIKWYLFAFTIAAPIATIITSITLTSISSRIESFNMAWWTGVILLFSAGSFLYVATIHVLSEIFLQKARLNYKQILIMIAGMMLPTLVHINHD